MTGRADIVAFDVADWPPDEEYPIFPEGSREKRRLRCPEPALHTALIPRHPYLFKKSRGVYPEQFWAEVVAFHVGCLCGVPVARTFPAYDTRTGECGALSEWLYGHLDQPRESLLSGGVFMKAAIKDYDFRRGRQHSFATIELVCRVLANPSQLTNASPRLDEDWPEAWARMLTFDALIGNTDRHHENWGFLVRSRRRAPAHFRLAPAFDNGTSLGHEWSNAQLARFDDPRVLLRYIERGCHHMRWHVEDAYQAGHAELLQKLLERYPQVFPAMRSVLAFDAAELDRRLQGLSALAVPVTLSPERAGFMLRLLRARRDRLLDALTQL